MSDRPKVVIVGGGPAALMAAIQLDSERYDIHIFEQGKRLGAKFLVAGNGGFNLTHSNQGKDLIGKYIADESIKQAIAEFDSGKFQIWLEKIGIDTFVGTSGRVFPTKGVKPIDVLKSFQLQLSKNTVEVHLNHTLTAIHQDALTFNHELTIGADYFIYALGGKSWAKTGSDGQWVDLFRKHKVDCVEFRPSNCGFNLDWNQDIMKAHAGQPLKNIGLHMAGNYVKGELMINEDGIEGGAIYALSNSIVRSLDQDAATVVFLDMKPNLTATAVRKKLIGRSTSKALRDNLRLNKIHLDLLKSLTTKEEYTDRDYMTRLVKALPLKVNSARPMDEAISTSGGISTTELSNHFELKKLPNHFTIGEMVDWDTITGGYLIQGCMSMAVKTANFLNTKASSIA